MGKQYQEEEKILAGGKYRIYRKKYWIQFVLLADIASVNRAIVCVSWPLPNPWEWLNEPLGFDRTQLMNHCTRLSTNNDKNSFLSFLFIHYTSMQVTAFSGCLFIHSPLVEIS